MKSTTIKILALVLTACVFLGVTSCSLFGGGAEEETTEPTTVASATPLKTDSAEVLAYFNTLMAKVKAGKVAVNYSSSFDPKNFDCENENFKASLPTIVKLMKKGFNDGRGAEVAYGDPLTDIIPMKGQDAPFVLTMDHIAKSEDGAYQIAVNAEAFSRREEASSKAEAEQANLPEGETVTTEYIEVDEDVRKITITLVDEEDPQAGAGLMGSIFDIPDRAKIAEEMKAIEGYVKYDGTYKAKYTGCTIYMEINRITDEVIKVEFNRNIEVEVNVTGVGTLSSLGETTLKFVVNGSDCYEFNWADPNATTAVAE
ncbi:MAG: hypothetical protein IIW48_12665 [Clostridia bacterium]|nr:hypothetical protein [Clostridia bacterium]